MIKNKLSYAVRVASAALALGMAAQVNAIEVQAGDTKLDIYGYARLNASYDINEDISTTRGTRSGNFSMVNTGAAEDNEVSGHFGADAFQSRIGIRTTLPQGVKVTVSTDFRSISGSPGNARIRHAFGEYNGVLLGRTWSNYNSFVGNTSVLEFDALAGTAGHQGRVAQARYTSGPLSLSVEDATTRIFGTTDKKSSMPALTARYETKINTSSVSAAALIQQVEFDDGANDDTAFGYGVFVAGKIPLTGALTLQGALNYTDGASNNLWRSGTNYYGEDAYFANNSLETITSYGGSVGAQLKVGPGAINAGVGMTQMDWDDAIDDGLAVGSKHERNWNGMVNYQWSPVDQVTLGLQYSYYAVKKVNGDDGDANRLIAAATYSF